MLACCLLLLSDRVSPLDFPKSAPHPYCPSSKTSPPSHLFSSSKRACRQWENHSHAEFITAVVTQNHGYNFNNCRPQLSKQLHWNLIPVDFSFILCQGHILIRSAKTTGLQLWWMYLRQGGGGGVSWMCTWHQEGMEIKPPCWNRAIRPSMVPVL